MSHVIQFMLLMKQQVHVHNSLFPKAYNPTYDDLNGACVPQTLSQALLLKVTASHCTYLRAKRSCSVVHGSTVWNKYCKPPSRPAKKRTRVTRPGVVDLMRHRIHQVPPYPSLPSPIMANTQSQAHRQIPSTASWWCLLYAHMYT